MKNLLARIRVMLGAAPTYLVAAGTVVTILSDELAKVLPSGWQDNAARIAGTLLGVIAAAVAIVRRVSPVLDKNDHGILPPTP